MRQKEKKKGREQKLSALEYQKNGINVPVKTGPRGIQPRNYGKQSGGTLPYPN